MLFLPDRFKYGGYIGASDGSNYTVAQSGKNVIFKT